MCYVFFGEDDKRNFSHRPSNEQLAIAACCTLSWGVRKCESFLTDTRQLELPAFSDEEVEAAAVDGYYGRGQIYGKVATYRLEDVIESEKPFDLELAEILQWNHFHEFGGWAALERQE